MAKIMLINVTHSEESRVGIVHEGVLEAFEIESLSREHLKGNIYKGVVHRIHPALEAAFVDIGGARDAFLPLDEICFRNLPQPSAPHDEGESGENGRERRRLRDILHPGEELLVQIAKEPYGNKPPTLTTFYSLPGRYLVLLPGSADAGISRRIEGEERARLRQLITDLHPPDGYGVIVRTAAGYDHDRGELARDLAYLQRVWETVKQAAAGRRGPALVYREHDIVLRTIRDFYTPDIDEIYVDNEEVYQRAREFFHDVMPGKEHVLHCYRGEQPIFSAFDVETQFESIFKRRLPLRSGGGIVIDTTEALTAIDVNSGGSVRGPNPEETAFRTNLEAAKEIARQLRLRDIGGLIVIDFIDMRDPGHVHDVERVLREAMRPDKARHEIGRISRFGLLEISRQRLRPAAMATTYTTCAMCEGHGAVRTTESAALVALRKIHNRVALGDVAALKVALPVNVALYLLNQKRDDLAQLEERYGLRIQVQLSDALMPHQVELEARVRTETEAARPPSPGEVAPANGTGTSPATAAAPNGGKRRRRRGGRRRRGKSLRAAAAIGEALASLGHVAGAEISASPPCAVAAAGGPAELRAPAGAPSPEAAGKPAVDSTTPTKRRRARSTRSRRRTAAPAAAAETPAPLTAQEAPAAVGATAAPPRRRRRTRTPTKRTRGGRSRAPVTPTVD
jgi:ribonuclease E